MLSLRELENLTRRYAHELSNAGFFGPAIDVLGTDAGTGPREMAWMMETYMNHNPNDTDALACITGKPESLHGLKGSSEATGLGLFYSLKEFLNHDENTVNLDMQPTMEG